MKPQPINNPIPLPALPVELEDLLQRMTLDEKVGQLVQVDTSWKQDVPRFIREGRVGSLLSVRDPQAINAFQRIAVEESRLGIPLVFGNDVLHGYRTIFPIPLALSCAWDPQLVEDTAAAIACESLAAGTNWNFAPMVDIARDPRWGRIAEGAGEDPFLGSHLARAWVCGFQTPSGPGGRRMAACVKHFAAYGGAEAGRDYNTVDMSEQRLRNEYLPPYRAALQAGAASLMTSFNELNGVPATANTFLLQDLLRREWGFEGLVVSDFDAIGELILHGYAADHRQAALLSFQAGVDMDMMGNAYPFHLSELVRQGQASEVELDAAVRCVLAFKFQLGLFAQPYVDECPAEIAGLHELALQAACQSLVLLKNENGLLPLDLEGKTVAVIGPLAGARQDLLGSWSCDGRPEETATFLESFSQALPAGSRLVYAQGCELDGEQAELAAAQETAAQADVVVMLLGESAEMSGEAHARAHLGLPGRQQELVEALSATGKPLVAVLVCGRPLVLTALERRAGAILLGWQGGTYAAQALSQALLGQVNPSGKLTASFPRSEGQIPIYYAYKRTGRPADVSGITQFNQEHKSIYLDEAHTPLYPFGFGLSYTRFSYHDLVVETPVVEKNGCLVVSAGLTNSGSCGGVEIAQCYVRDLVGSLTRPVKELKGFQKVSLPAGASRLVRFEIPAVELGFYGPDLQYRVEAGDFRVWIGGSSGAELQGTFSVAA